MSTGSSPTNTVGSKESIQQQSNSYSMDRIRLESIEKRKQECAQIIKDRKRKLSELYCVARLPFVPISLDQVQHIEEKLKAFLEKNDLENGHTFDISYLSKDKIFRKSLSPQHQIHNQNDSQKSNMSSPGSPRTNSNQNSEPPKKIRKLDSPIEHVPSLKAPVVDEKVLSNVAKAKSTSPSPILIDRKLNSSSSITEKGSETIPDSVEPLENMLSSDGTENKPEEDDADNEDVTQKQKHEDEKPKESNNVVVASDVPNTKTQDPSLETKKESTPNIDNIESTKTGEPNNIEHVHDVLTEKVLKPTIVHVMKDPSPKDPPMLSQIITNYAKDSVLKRSDAPSDRDLPYKDVDIKKLMIALMPEKKPHKVAEARSLTELYYQQQTLQLQKLLLRAHKTLNTEAFETALVEGKVSVLHSRIEELKRKNSWSLRQPRKFVDPFLRQGRKTHWDNLISEGKWLSTDFSEGRRYKMAQCVYLSQAIEDYWTYGKVCCIKRAAIVHLDENYKASQNEDDAKMDVDLENNSETHNTDKDDSNEPVDIVMSEKENDNNVNEEEEIVERMTVIDEKVEDNRDEKFITPDTDNAIEKDAMEIIATEEENVYTQIPAFTYPEYKRALEERFVPFNIYAEMDAFTSIEKSVINNISFYSPFDDKEADHVVEKELFGHISAMLPPLDEEPQFEKILYRKMEENDKRLPRSQNGLFGPYRRINILKPPKPPQINQLNIRIPTIWLPQDDKYLIKYVSEFSFNWDVISAHLSAKPTRSYTSNIERRTPWQCFERYIQLNDKFQFTDMRGMNAIDAKDWLEAAHQAQATTKRRISPLGVGIDSIQRGNRRLRWASMFEAMRKLMKRRESQQKPTPQPRKHNPDMKKSDTPTPEDLAKLKNDRDRAIQESYTQQGRNQNYARSRGVPIGNAIGNDGRKPEQKMSNVLASPQHSNHSADATGTQMVNGLPTTPGGSQFTPEQIQRFLQLQKQRQLAQRQKSMQGSEHDKLSASPATSNPVLHQAISQPPLSTSNSQSNLSAYNSPTANLNNNFSAIPQAHRVPQSNSYSQSLNSSPQPQFGNIRSNSPAVLTPEQVLQNAKLGPSTLGNANVASPNPSLKGNRSDSPNGIKKPIKQKFQLSHQQVSSIINQIQMKHPNLEKSQVTQLAGTYISRLQQANQLQTEKQQQPVQHQNQTQNQLQLSQSQLQLQQQQLQMQQQQQYKNQTQNSNQNQNQNQLHNQTMYNQTAQHQIQQHPTSALQHQIQQKQQHQQHDIPLQMDHQLQPPSVSGTSTPSQQFVQNSVSNSPAPVPGEKKSVNTLTPDQLNTLLKNPKLTDSQRKQLMILRQKQFDQQQKAVAQGQNAQLNNRSDSNSRVNTSSITTRFSPQPGSSSNSANLNYYPKNNAVPNGNFSSNSNVGTPNGNEEVDEFAEMGKIDELFGLNPESNHNK